MSKKNKQDKNQQQEQIQKKELKDRTHFIILTSIVVPITVAVIGVFGTVILPRLLDKASSDSNTANQPVSSNTSPVNTAGKVVIVDGFLPPDKIVSYVKAKNYSFTLNNTSQPGDFEMQKVGSDYYLIGYSMNPINVNNIFLVTSSSKDYSQKLQINIKDINSIAVSNQKDKKDPVSGLTISAKTFSTL